MFTLLIFCFLLTLAGFGAVFMAFVYQLPTDEEEEDQRKFEEGFCFHDY